MPHLAAMLVVAALLATATVPALADPGASSASGGASASKEVIVERGDRGSAVRAIQRKLGITADGVFGPMTERAVKRFQRRHDLVPDGIVGPITRGALGLEPFSARSVRRSRSRGVRLPRVLRRIAECESGGNWSSTVGSFDGGIQFQDSTWDAYGGEQYAPTADQATREQQIAIATKVRDARGGYSAWPGCAKKLGLPR